MKKNILIILLIILLYTPICLGTVEYSTQEELKKIEDEVEQCINKNYMTDYAMMQCSLKGIEKYNNEIEKTVKAAKNLLSKEQYKQFLKTQKKWEEFMKEKDTFLKQTFEKNCPPYLPCLVATGHKYYSIERRAQDLSGFCSTLILFNEQGVLDDDLNFVPFEY